MSVADLSMSREQLAIIKAKHSIGTAVLIFRDGDFYDAYYEDARIIGQTCDLMEIPLALDAGLSDTSPDRVMVVIHHQYLHNVLYTLARNRRQIAILEKPQQQGVDMDYCDYQPVWPKGLIPREIYERREDMGNGHIRVFTDVDGDACLTVYNDTDSCSVEFCTILGGGRSPRVRDALLQLANAIRLDNETRPE